jgi:uncharacterized hydrophobic protein (TIGR00271 family)
VQLLGSSIEGRPSLVAGMLERNANESTSYWLQLVVSIGIATLGLVVGSTAVIIGAMLVAPLMGPIVAVAMGLATGSPFLVLRSAARIVASVLVAIGGAALITSMLPFHELNEEITARTLPTVLDLLTAGFCALAGVYASLRPGSDTASTAAGTSIGISLVPPLCASGYGFGSGTWSVAGGAALLFLTNIVAIIFVGTVSFVAAGFNRVDVTTLERTELARNHDAVLTAAIARRLAGLFESQAGPLLRFLMPLVLLSAVYVPLRQALDEVAWEARARAAVHAAVKRDQDHIVQSQVRVERHGIGVRLVVVGTNAEAEARRERLIAEIQNAAGIAPHVEVLAIPDASAFAGLASTLRTQKPMPSSSPARGEQLESAHQSVRAEVSRLWPTSAAGEPLAVEFGTNESAPLNVRIVHLGEALTAAGTEAFERSLRAALDRDVRVDDIAIPREPITRADGDLSFVSRLALAVRASAGTNDVHACVVEPPPVDRKSGDSNAAKLALHVRDVLANHPRVTTESGDVWSVRFARGACSSPSDAGIIGETSARDR